MIALLKSSWGSRNNFWSCSLIPSPLKKRQPWKFSSLQRVWSWGCHILKAVVICSVLWTGIEMSGFLCHLSGCVWVCHAPVEAGVSLMFDIQHREQPPCPTSWQNLKLGVCIQSSQVFPASLTLGSYSWRVYAVWMSHYLVGDTFADPLLAGLRWAHFAGPESQPSWIPNSQDTLIQLSPLRINLSLVVRSEFI